MFTQIQTELDLLVVKIENEINQISMIRQGENNSNLYIEYGGRLIGLTSSLAEIRNTQILINEHIIEILKNTSDGNYLAKLDMLVDENDILRKKVDILEEDLKKYDTLKNKKDKNIVDNIPVDCLKELSEEEIDNKIIAEIEKGDMLYSDYDFDDEDEE